MTEFDVTIPRFADDRAESDGLIRIQWRNGAPQLRTVGRFFVPADRLPEDVTPGAPWKPVNEVFESGDEVAGYQAERLGLIIITHRAQPFVRTADNQREWLERWQRGRERQSLQVEVLCIADGLEEVGPVVWSSSTVKTSFAIISRGRGGEPAGIIPRVLKEIVEPAAQRAKKYLDTYCFRVEITTERDSNGKAVYTEAGTRKVTRPVLALEANPPIETIRTLWIGNDRIRDLVPIRERYEEWRKARRSNEPVEASPSPSRNAPESIDDDLF
jgi:hypothetical protein